MDEYTPTTEQVRIAFGYESIFVPQDAEMYEAFDRWLAEHDRVVAANAWEQGTLALHATVSEYMPGSRPPTNPYRITEENN